MASVALVGATGLTGSHILSVLRGLDTVSRVYAFSRSDLPSFPRLTTIVSTDSSEWADRFPTSPPADLYISALGITRARAGGLEGQRRVDYDLSLSLAKAARAAGARVFVFVSVAGASISSPLPYPRMKAEVEAAAQELGFDRVVILRPGLIVGPRKEFRAAEALFRNIAGVSPNMFRDFWAQDALVIARAAVSAGMHALHTVDDDEAKEKVTMLYQTDIIKLGRTEWKD